MQLQFDARVASNRSATAPWRCTPTTPTDGASRRGTSAGTWYTFRDLEGNPVYEYKTGAGDGFLTYNHSFQGRLVFTNTALASPTKRWIYSDHPGSPRLRLDASGTEKSRHWYYPFGEEFQPPANPVIFRYNAKERDSETGMHDYGARYYDTLMGRFTAVDPARDSGVVENPQTWNRYAYAIDNPMVYNDPDGKSATIAGAVGGAVIGGAVAWFRGENVWKGAVSGAVAGAIAGSVIDTGGASLGVAVLAGAAGNIGGGIVSRELDGKATTAADIILDGALGAAAGAGGGVLARALPSGAAVGLSSNARYAQTTFSESFSAEGSKILSGIAGKQISTVSDLAASIRSGAVKASDIPVNVIERNGTTLILNTRTVQALERAGVPRSQFNVVKRTGEELYEQLLDNQLKRNGLTSQGTASVTPTGN